MFFISYRYIKTYEKLVISYADEAASKNPTRFLELPYSIAQRGKDYNNYSALDLETKRVHSLMNSK